MADLCYAHQRQFFSNVRLQNWLFALLKLQIEDFDLPLARLLSTN